MKKVQIFFIYADNCEHCQQALETINSAILKSKKPCEILKFEYNNPAAVNIAINNGINDLPGFVVGSNKYVFNGDNYTEEAIIKAIKSS